MRIEAYNKVSSIYQASKPQNVGKTSSKPKKYDQVEISRAGCDYQTAKKALNNIPDVRQDKIDEIKRCMASGTYNISMQEVADKMINSYFDEEI